MQYATKLNDKFVQSYRDRVPPWGPVGYVTYKRTYSRETETGFKEEWWQTVARCCQGILDIGGLLSFAEIHDLYDKIFNLKCCFSGRALWQLGTPNIQKIGADSLQNCWHVTINEPEAFCFTFNQLMLGGGVGYNITPEFVYELPAIKYGTSVRRVSSADVDFIVPDNREGWVELLRRVLHCFMVTGHNLTYSTECVRQKGKPIATFGGTASGSEILVAGIKKIVGILQSRLGHKLRPIDCLDILNIIGTIVVAGNVRRSAELALGSSSDKLFLTAKDWKGGIIPNWRSMSNNSVSCTDIEELPEEFWKGYVGGGEPYGLINLDLFRSHGRLDDPINYRPDYGITGTNPCGEIGLEPYEACNLFEIFLPNITTTEEFLTTAQLGYKVCKSISAFQFSDPHVNEVVSRNHRLGVGICGVLQSPHIQDPTIFDLVYDALENLDLTYSKELGVKPSVKLTTIKPSGTVSLLPGVTPGIHAAYAPYYIRRIRFASDDPLVDTCRKAGYHVEPVINFDGSRDLGTLVVSFPVKTPPSTIMADKVSAIDMLSFQNLMQTHWSDNSISMTCYYREDELEEIKEYLKQNYASGIKAVSFLLRTGHGFAQAPLQAITKTKYEEMTAETQQITDVKIDNTIEHFNAESECESGVCPIK